MAVFSKNLCHDDVDVKETQIQTTSETSPFLNFILLLDLAEHDGVWTKQPGFLLTK